MKNFKIVLFLILLILSPSCSQLNQIAIETNIKIKNSHLTDGWYPQNKNILEKTINNYFNIAKNNFDTEVNPNNIKAIIVPHAGFYYSGICSSCAYINLLKDKQNLIKNNFFKKVIILSPTHTKYFSGIALPNYDLYQTVLGNIEIDKNSIDLLSKNNNFKIISGAHDQEHAIEIQLPLIQKVLENFKLIPLIVSNINTENIDEIKETLAKIIDNQTLIIISTDFMHFGQNYNYLPFNKDIFDSIRYVDSLAIENLINKNFDQFNVILEKTGTPICGQNCLKILIRILSSITSIDCLTNSRLCCYYSSAQIEKALSNNNLNIQKLFEPIPDNILKTSVSYASLIFANQDFNLLSKEKSLTEYEKKSLLALARNTIKNNFKPQDQKIPEQLLWPIKSSGIQQTKGAFVTLNKKDGNLRGCIGNIVTDQPLFLTVQNMSKAAAFQDTRFEPLKETELDDIVIDITILSEPKPIKNYNEIILGKHGIILKKQTPSGYKSAVFLPQVPLSFGWDIRTTLEQLSLKAGLGRNDWQENCEFEVFEGFEIKEK